MSRRARTSTFVLLGYTATSFLFFGLRIASHPERAILGSGRDPQIFIWSFAWWPHAIGAGENPFFTHAIYAPHGINLAWTTSVPLLALVFTPLTVLFGPVLSYNVAAMLMPALAAWTAFLLCRYLTKSLWASLVGGYLFGFSGYMLAQETGHLHMTAVFLLPLIALVVLRRLRGEIDARGLAWRLGVLLGLQFWLSTEILFTVSVALACSLLLAFWLVRDVRARLRGLLFPLLAACGIAALVSGPLGVYALTGFASQSINQPSLFNGDLLNFVVPTHLIAGGGWSTLGDISSHFPSSNTERGAYIGLPTLLIVAWFVVRNRRTPSARFLAATLLLSALVTLGTALQIKGRHHFTLPLSYIFRLPLFDNALPVRFALFSSLAAAVMVALWTASRRGWIAWLVPAIAVASLFPSLWEANYRTVPERWPFFTDGLYKVCIPKNENIAIFPYGFWDNSMLWQAESGFWFRMAEGYLRPKPPPSSLADPTILELTYTTMNPTAAQILAFAKTEKVDRIVSVGIYVHPNSNQMHKFGAVQNLGGVLVSPACGYPSLRQGVHPTPLHPSQP